MPGTPFPSVIDLGALGAAGFKILGDADDDLAGHAVAFAGDFNGDGFGDIIVGAPGNDGEAGAAYLIFGKASGFGTVDLASLAAADGFKITGDLAVDYAGFSVASAGDVNGDGFDDIVVGARYNDAGAADGGAAYVIFGKASGFGAIDLAALAPADGFRIEGAADYDQAGFSVASAGDVDGDGYDDLLVGAVGHDGDGTNRGAAYVIFGKQSGLGDIDLASLAPADGFVLRGGDDNDAAGTSVSSAGDVNGDGIGDIIVGAPNVDDNATSSYGAAYVIFGRETGWADLDLASLDPAEGFRIQGGSAYDFAGTSVASAGDVNGDGFADLLIGAPRYTEPGDYPGAAYVVFGKESGFSDIDLASLAPADGFRIRGAGNYDLTGYSVASAGDVNGDGFDDLIIGARENDGGGSNAGAAFVVFGKAWGFGDIDLASLGSADGFKIQGEVFNDVAGWSVSSAGDVNDDGYDDMLVGARSNDGGDPNAGAAYVIFGHAVDDQPQRFYQPESDDSPVNTISANAQTEPAITFLADGRYVVTWTSADGGLAGEEVRARIFNADGTEDVAEFVVNTVPAGDQDSSAVAALDPEGFVIVWRDAATTDIMAQRYAATGASLGAPVLVNGSTLDTASDPSVAGRPGGGFVVSWTDASGASTEVMARVFDSSGTALGVEFQVNMATSLAQEHSGVAVLSDGNFVVVWKDGSGEGHDTDGTGIRMRVFSSTGSALIGEVAVNSTTASTQEFPVIAALSGGRFVVAWVDWSGTGTDTSGSAIRARVFQGDTPIGADFVVNTNVLNGQSQPTIDAAPDGGFTIGWTDASGATTDIRAQRFDASGNRIGDEVLVNAIATGAQDESALSIAADGTLVVVWTDASGSLDSSGTGIAQRLFSESDAPTLDLNGADGGNGFASAYSEGGDGARVADDDALVTAPDHQVTGATIAITDAVAGDQLVLSGDLPAGITAGGTGTATITLSGTATAGDYEEALRLILYTSTGDNPTAGGGDLLRTITIVLTDGLNDSETATAAVTITAVNDAPTAAVADGLAAIEQVALSLKGSMSVADADAGSGSLTAILSVGFGVLHLEAGTSGAGISNNDSAAVTITGTLAQINALLSSDATSVATFTANTDTPPATTTLTLAVNDGGNTGSGGALPGSDNASIAITAVNDAPVNTVPGTLNLSEDAVLIPVAGLQVSDVEAGPAGQPLTVTLSVARGTLTISTAIAGGIDATHVSGGAPAASNQTSITITATQAQINATLAGANGLTYTPTSNVNGNDTLTIVTSDLGYTGTGGTLTDTDTRTLNVGAVNDAPTIGDGSESVPAILEDTPNTSANAETLTQLFGPQFSDATDQVAGGSSTNTFLGIAIVANGSNGNGTWEWLDGAVWTPIGAATQAAAKTFDTGTQIRFNPATDYNGTAPTLTAHLVDNSSGTITNGNIVNLSGVGATGGTTRYSAGTVELSQEVTAVNDQPTANDDLLAATEDTPVTYATADLTGNDTDPEPDTLTVASVSNATGGTAMRNGDGTVTFTPTPDFNGAAGFDYVVSDGQGGTDTGHATVNVAAVNDAPAIGDGTETAAPFPEDQPSLDGDSVADLLGGQYSDLADSQTASGGSSADAFAGIAITGGSSSAAGQWQYFNGSSWVDIGAASLDAARLVNAATSIRFNPAENFNGAAPLLTVRLIDGSGAAFTDADTADLSGLGATGGATRYSAGSVTLSQEVTAVNDAPTVAIAGGLAATEQVPLDLKGTIAIGDVDAGAGTITVTLAVDHGVIDVDAGTSGADVSDSGTGTVTITGTLAEVQALLDSDATSAISYTADTDAPPASAALSVSVDDGGNSGTGGALTGSDSETIAITAINDAPAGADKTIAIDEDATRVLTTADFGYTDGEGDAFLEVRFDTAPTGGRLYLDDDGLPGTEPVWLSHPAVVSASDIALGRLTFTPDSDIEGTAAASIAFLVVAAGGSPNTDPFANTISFDIHPANDPPTLAGNGINPTFTENGAGVDLYESMAVSTEELGQLFNQLVFTVSGLSDGSSEHILIDGTQVALVDGNQTTASHSLGVTVAVAAGTATVTVSGDMAWGTFIVMVDSLAYSNTSENPTAGSRTVTLTSARDNGGTGHGGVDTTNVSIVSTVTVVAVNDIPALDLDSTRAGQDFVAAYTENGAPVLITPNALVSDVDSTNFSGGKLGVFFASNGDIGDSFLIISTGTGPGQISTSGTDVLYEGVVIATGAHGSGSMVLNLNANATPTAIQALLRQVAIFSTRDSFAASSWNVAIELNDGDGSQFVPGSRFAGGVIDITVVDDAADARNDAFNTDEATNVVGNVFANNGSGSDVDPDGPPFTVVAVSSGPVGSEFTLPSGALLTLNANGTFTYNPNGVFNATPAPGSGASNQPGTDNFTYTLAGGGTATVTVTIDGLDNDDVLSGTAGADSLDGGGGADYLDGSGGDDLLSGGSGADAIDGGDGLDRILGGAEADYVVGRDGDDIVYGEAGDDVLNGDGGDDYLDGGADDDRLYGGIGGDFLLGGSGSDLIDGGSGGDVLYGGGGHDRFVAGDGADTVEGGADADVAYGEAGDDDLRGGDGNDYLEGGDGNDFLTGDVGIDVLVGGFGDDRAYGGTGNDIAAGSGGNDILYGEAGEDDLRGEDGNDYLDGGEGEDRLYGGLGGDFLLGGLGADFLDGGVEADVLYGGEGDDRFLAGEGDDTVEGGAGADVAYGGLGNDAAYGLDGNDYLDGEEGDDFIDGGAGADVLIGGAGNDRVNGGTEADIIAGGTGSDILYGEAGDDELRGGENADYMEGGAGADFFLFDTALGGGNVDVVGDFAAGADKLVLDDAVFEGLGLGALSASAFVVGSSAQEADDRIIYDSDTGALYFDADGTGAIAQVQFAILADVPAITASDFTVI